MATLEKGDKAPVFKLKDQNGKEVSLSDYKGKKVMVYFYPKADTPGCTKQACSIRDAESTLQEKGLRVLGISADKPEKQEKFDKKYSLGFPLLSDPHHTIAEAYGVWGEKKMFGKISMGITRSSFLIDENGKLIGVWYNVKPAETVPKALELL